MQIFGEVIYLDVQSFCYSHHEVKRSQCDLLASGSSNFL